MTLEIRAATDLGMKRSQNEDSHGTWVSDDPVEREQRGVLVVVADGMGGSRAGEVASRLAVETVIRTYREGRSQNPLDDLYRAVENANQVVHTESVSHPDMSGMGTTCTALVVRGPDAYVAHVGDSRCYAVLDGRLRQLTQDHSLVAQLVRDGQLTPAQARTDPRRNVVTRSVGVGANVEIDAQRFESLLREGDTLLLCSDGLHGLVSDDELAHLASEDRLDDACVRAIVTANQRGGHDNITVVLARAHESSSAPAVLAAEVPVEPRARHFTPGHLPDDDRDREDVEHTQISMPAMRRAEPVRSRDEDDEDDAVPIGPRAAARAVAVENQDSKKTALWIFVALVVLLIAIAAAALVLIRMNRQSSALGSNAAPETRSQLAWR